MRTLFFLIAGCIFSVCAEEAPVTDGEVWNEGVEYFRNNDVTNALRVLRPLMLSKTHGARAAEVVAKLEYDRGNLEEAAGAAQIALRAAPDDAKANRNFTRATDGLPQFRETKRINAILQAAQGKDPGSMLLAATKDARRIFDELMWYVAANNRIEGDGSGATTNPKSAFRPEGTGLDDPADAVYSWWPARAAQKRRAIARLGGKVDVVFVGDSITHYFGDDNGRGQKVWREMEKEFSLLDLGYSGQRTENMIWRMTHGELDGYEAKAVTVLAGTNNRNPPADIARGIRRLVEVIRGRQPKAKVFLMAVFPRGEKPDDPHRERLSEVNRLVRGIADGTDVIWCDIGARMLSSDGTLSKEICHDFLHPTEKGYSIWRDEMVPRFRAACSGGR